MAGNAWGQLGAILLTVLALAWSPLKAAPWVLAFVVVRAPVLAYVNEFTAMQWAGEAVIVVTFVLIYGDLQNGKVPRAEPCS